MAFVSMIFVFLAIALIILGILFIAGLILLIVGIVNKRKPKNKGKKYPVVLIVIGSLLLVLPVGTAVTLTVSMTTSAVTTGIKRMDYENVTDKWRNEWTTDNSAAADAIEELLSCADSGDRERFAKTFTPNIQQSEGFEGYLDDFFAAYPVGMSRCELDGGNVGSSGSYNYGHNIQTGSTSYTCVLDGEWYRIRMSFCYENTDSPDDVGVTFFSIENLGANAMDIDYDIPLVCNIKSGVSARLIDNMAFLFEPTPDRVITVEEMTGYLAKYNTLYDISQEIGEPNVTKKYSNCTGYENYYELAPENGEPRYAYICTNSPTGRFLYGYICSDTETFYDYELFPDK
ncbi:MAG: DUF5104 domain-containing protein [Oscillospiraceae bacterium]